MKEERHNSKRKYQDVKREGRKVESWKGRQQENRKQSK
jgi:hypothetical protein